MSDNTILIIADERARTRTGHFAQQQAVETQYKSTMRQRFGGDNEVIVEEIDPTSSADRLRGRHPDLIVLTTDISAKTRSNIIRPMTATTDAQIIEL